MKARLEKDLFKAAMFAKKMTDDGVPFGLAAYKAGQYYGYSASDVAWARTQLKQEKSRFSSKRDTKRVVASSKRNSGILFSMKESAY